MHRWRPQPGARSGRNAICPAILVDVSVSDLRITRLLEGLAVCHGLPEEIVIDNGPEMTGRAVLEWSRRTGVRPRFIEPGKPIQNAFAESFIGKFRDECLNENWFSGLADARQTIETWRRHDKTERPHSALSAIDRRRSPRASERLWT